MTGRRTRGTRTALAGAALAGALTVATLGAPGAANAATFAGGNGSLYYSRFVGGTAGSQIWSVTPAGTAKALSGTSFDDAQPAVSPSGKLIAFVHGGAIWTMTTAGGSRHNLTPGSSTLSQPAWSADGTRLAYTDNARIGVMNANGSGAHLLTTSGQDYEPDWSPDGRSIAFTSYRSNDITHIFVMHPDGTGLTDLSAAAGIADPDLDAEPAWAPDSARLAFVSTRAHDGLIQIFQMSRTGGSLVQLVDSRPSGAHSPAYSPDGTTLAFTANNNGATDVFTEPLNGPAGGGTPLTATNDTSIGDTLGWGARVTTTLGLSPASGPAGTHVTVTLAGFGIGEPVSVTFTDGAKTVSLGTVTTGASGSGSLAAVIPASSPSGTGRVRATGSQTARQASHTFTVG